MMAGKVAVRSSYSTRAVPRARLTAAARTPGVFSNAFSTAAVQLAQCIPVIRKFAICFRMAAS